MQYLCCFFCFCFSLVRFFRLLFARMVFVLSKAFAKGETSYVHCYNECAPRTLSNTLNWISACMVLELKMFSIRTKIVYFYNMSSYVVGATINTNMYRRNLSRHAKAFDTLGAYGTGQRRSNKSKINTRAEQALNFCNYGFSLAINLYYLFLVRQPDSSSSNECVNIFHF